MILWAVLGAMTVVALALVLPPLLRRQRETAAGASHDIEVYRHQLSELERDQERGLLTPAEATAARTEIERRLLRAADDVEGTLATGGASGSKARVTAVVIAVLLPVLAGIVYIGLGAPGLPGAPFAERDQSAGTALAELEARARSLEKSIAENPHDPSRWLDLAQTLRSLRRFAASADAFARVVALGDNRATLHAAQGEMLVMAADGQVTPQARAAFDTALTQEPREPRARFYMALAALQSGDPEQAVRLWLALEAETAADAPWRPILERRIRETAEAHDIDVAALRAAQSDGAASPTGPSKEAVEAAREMTPEQRAEMIRGMVERLAARLADKPDDLEGWRRLGRAYAVLGEADKSADAYGKAAALAPENTEVLLDYGQALLVATVGAQPGAPLPPDFVKIMHRVLKLDDKNAVALWYLGMAELQAGDKEAARGYWQRLLAQIPESAPERAEIERRILALVGDKK